jgi:hypothetical protein
MRNELRIHSHSTADARLQATKFHGKSACR